MVAGGAARLNRCKRLRAGRPHGRLSIAMPNRRASLPRFIEPQLSLLVKVPPASPGWAHELKYERLSDSCEA